MPQPIAEKMRMTGNATTNAIVPIIVSKIPRLFISPPYKISHN